MSDFREERIGSMSKQSEIGLGRLNDEGPVHLAIYEDGAHGEGTWVTLCVESLSRGAYISCGQEKRITCNKCRRIKRLMDEQAALFADDEDATQ